MPGQIKGFTLIELLVTIAIAAILVTAGIPAFSQFVRENRHSNQINRLVRALKLARSTAITRSVPVTVCAGTTDGSSGHCQRGKNWSGGWMIFVDNDKNGKFKKPDELLHAFKGFDGTDKMTAHIDASYPTFSANGLSNASGYFKLCDSSDSSYARGVVLGPTGSARASSKDDDNNTLTCS
jgi:type IV fimbrial biogenesis protein FimT